MDNNYDSFFLLNVLANVLQIADFQMNVTQLSNDELMKHLLEQDKELKKQDSILEEQTEIYLKKLVKQNEEIIELLKGDTKNA